MWLKVIFILLIELCEVASRNILKCVFGVVNWAILQNELILCYISIGQSYLDAKAPVESGLSWASLFELFKWLY